MGVGDSTIGTERINASTSQSSLAVLPFSDHLHDSSAPAAATIPSAELMNIDIGDLPEAVLVETLGRFPCHEDIARCKCVSKHWCTVMSEPSFIHRFLCLQGDVKQTFMRGTLINEKGEEFLNRMSSSSKPLTPLFLLLMEFHHLKEEPVVVATYNDLFLCCASLFYQRDYYICNPYTLKWVPLPPPPQVFKFTAVEFLCDLPYYYDIRVLNSTVSFPPSIKSYF